MIDTPFVCRCCGSADVALLLEMGALPLANAFVKDDADTADHFREQLNLVMCRACAMLQLREEVPPEQLFQSYLWVTSTSAGAAAHAVWLSGRLRERHGVSRTPFLVEVASNDGFFLRHYRDVGFKVLGVDPSNLALEAANAGLPSVRAFFSEAVARTVQNEHGSADVIVARNVLGHVNRPADFIAGIKHLLAPDGRFVLEVPYALMLRHECQYDTIFHEHVSYPTVRSLVNLLATVDLKIVDMTFVGMNGGSMLCEIVHAESTLPRADAQMLALEDMLALNVPEGWRSFSVNVAHQRRLLVAMLEELRAAGKVVVAYGAAAKSMTMLSFCGIDTRLLKAIGDANPRKQGLLSPGGRIPIVSPTDLLSANPDYILIGAWNFRDEIIAQFRRNGYTSQFIVPLPIPAIVDA